MHHIQTLQELVEEHWHETDPDARIPDNIPFLVSRPKGTLYYYHAGQDTFYRYPAKDVKRYAPIPIITLQVPTTPGLYRTTNNILWELFLDAEGYPIWRSMGTSTPFAPAHMYPHLPLTRVRIVDAEEPQHG